jgi:hypothetical protein
VPICAGKPSKAQINMTDHVGTKGAPVEPHEPRGKFQDDDYFKLPFVQALADDKDATSTTMEM